MCISIAAEETLAWMCDESDQIDPQHQKLSTEFMDFVRSGGWPKPSLLYMRDS